MPPIVSQLLIEMDRKDEQSGRMEKIYEELRKAYCQFTLLANRHSSKPGCLSKQESENDTESGKPGYSLRT